ncbi:IclR family transcriptional regulator [Pseudonocardia sp. GCM10023141]|uniref:IclR family transcriptional regulator n=1 Tax=Pseudonocardia sp. GCM10023141 TaxID=3252653 RepID=UPI00360F7C1F
MDASPHDTDRISGTRSAGATAISTRTTGVPSAGTTRSTGAGTPSATGTQSVTRALSILRSFSPSCGGVTGPQIAERFGYSLPTAHRLLRALEAERFLVLDPVTRRYRPGPEFLRLSAVIVDRDGGVAPAFAALRRLRDRTGETATMFWRFADERTCVREVPSDHAHRVTPGVGRRYPLARGAAGLVLLLGEDERAVRDRLRNERPGLLADLSAARARGFAVTVGETIPGAVAVAAPVPGLRRGLVAISVVGPAQRFGPAEAEAVGGLVAEEARRLTATFRH